ncbi:tyrosine-type recombinase/integrase [Bacteroides sp. AF20-13LB]|uniref:tyrosine-type recombinase/integrase n=1 Tax=Bacteroides sp. AF20-13LB TaxID=2292921 RepID=UPI00243683D1|nr:tyrosine-type recombinase/integrase [Bacteroides sp. AF20-13LB]
MFNQLRFPFLSLHLLASCILFHRRRHTFAVLAILKGMPLETLQKVLGHKSILSTQVYAELINPKVGEDTDRMCDKIGSVYRLAN